MIYKCLFYYHGVSDPAIFECSTLKELKKEIYDEFSRPYFVFPDLQLRSYCAFKEYINGDIVRVEV